MSVRDLDHTNSYKLQEGFRIRITADWMRGAYGLPPRR